MKKKRKKEKDYHPFRLIENEHRDKEREFEFRI